MKKRAVSMLLTAVMAVTGMAATATVAHAEGEEGKVINIYSWNDEFRTRWKLFIRKLKLPTMEQLQP